MDKKRAILFITRRFPPTIGGVEIHCFQLYSRLIKHHTVKLVALRRKTKLHLIWFLPLAYLIGIKEIMLGKVEVIYLADGVVSCLTPFLKLFTKLRIVTTIYGTEVTIKIPLLRWLIMKGIQRSDKVAVISQNTYEATAKLGVDVKRISLIYVGIKPLTLDKDECIQLQKKFEKKYNLVFGRDRILLNFGRLIPRKGVAVFLQKGLPLLEPDIKLIIGGDGLDYQKISIYCDKNNLHDRLIIVKQPSDDIIAMLRQSADLFLFPNIPFANDIEGFGMTQLESMYSGTPVVAFAVDALVESVRKGGYLIEPNNYQAFVDQIHAYYKLSQREKEMKRKEAQTYVRETYSWDTNAALYMDLFGIK